MKMKKGIIALTVVLAVIVGILVGTIIRLENKKQNGGDGVTTTDITGTDLGTEDPTETTVATFLPVGTIDPDEEGWDLPGF